VGGMRVLRSADCILRAQSDGELSHRQQLIQGTFLDEVIHNNSGH
jgi:hypothetical protein